MSSTDSGYVCLGCKREVPENAPCPYCESPSPDAEARRLAEQVAQNCPSHHIRTGLALAAAGMPNIGGGVACDACIAAALTAVREDLQGQLNRMTDSKLHYKAAFDEMYERASRAEAERDASQEAERERWAKRFEAERGVGLVRLPEYAEMWIRRLRENKESAE